MDQSFVLGGADAPAETRTWGPPWILGERGVPLEAPENTLASFRRALDAELDGLAYDLHACSGGDPLVIADERLERTTDGRGQVSQHSLPELFRLDAGGWFAKRFAGESLPHFNDVLELQQPTGGPLRHLVQVHDSELVAELGRARESWPAGFTPRFLTRRRDVCDGLLAQGLSAGLLLYEAGAEDLAWARDRRLELVALEAPGGWDTEVAAREWPFERWALALDDPEHLFAALRRGLNGISTREPRRALALRTLCASTPEDREGYPLEASPLVVASVGNPAGGGEWSGRWEPVVFVRNPFDHALRVACQVFVRRGAFEVQGLPQTIQLDAGQVARVSFRISGGSWSPGGDPIFAALYEWEIAGTREPGRLMLDIPLRRERHVALGAITQRVEMLRERPGSPRATMTLRRRRRELTVEVENPGGLGAVQAFVHLAGRTCHGARRVRAFLPDDFDGQEQGVNFSCGFVGTATKGGVEVQRRWSGGLPQAGDHGAPGKLFAK